MDELTRHNFGATLYNFAKSEKTSLDSFAKAIGCSKKSMQRLTTARSYPSDDMLKQGAILLTIGYTKYANLSEAEKEKISEKIGAVGGGVLGLGSVTAVVGALGTAGLSAAGIASGLAALGAVVGGGMAAGITVAATFPIAAGAAGYGLVKGIKAVTERYNTADKDQIDPKWEVAIR